MRRPPIDDICYNNDDEDDGDTKQNNDTIYDTILNNLKHTLLITGSFCVSWSWILVVYATSHVISGQDPLNNQISFGDTIDDGSNTSYSGRHYYCTYDLLILIFHYLFVCVTAAVVSNHIRNYMNQDQQQDPAPAVSSSSPESSLYSSYDAATNWNAIVHQYYYNEAMIIAVEFFPSPIFAGKLMGYLSQFQTLNALQRAIINVVATWIAAILSHVAITTTSPTSPSSSSSIGSKQLLLLHRTGCIVRDTLGFGLGIAWNVLMMELFAPNRRDNKNNNRNGTHSVDVLHLLALVSYLGFVVVIAFKLSALKTSVVDKKTSDGDNQLQEDSDEPPEEASATHSTTAATASIINMQMLYDTQIELLSFASYVVCAFTLVDVLNTILLNSLASTANQWIASIGSLLVLLIGAAIMSTVVEQVDNETGLSDDHHEEAFNSATSTTTTTASGNNYRDYGTATSSLPSLQPSSVTSPMHHPHERQTLVVKNDSKTNSNTTPSCYKFIKRLILYIPCSWCCCPWIPLLVLLVDTTDTIHVKDEWYTLIAMITGLACSIEGSSLLTTITDTVAIAFRVCNDERSCDHHPWMFVVLQFVLAMLTTLVLIPSIAPLVVANKKINK